MLPLGRSNLRLADTLLSLQGEGSSLLTEKQTTMKKPPQLQEDIIKAYERDYDITLEALPETIRVRGNALASGDDALDKEAEDEIIARLESGDVYAWFTAKVSVRDSHGREASDYLGACSYEDGEDFKRGGYYLDMIRECLDQIELADPLEIE